MAKQDKAGEQRRAEELDALFPKTEIFEIEGTSIELKLRPMSIVACVEFGRLAKPIFEELLAQGVAAPGTLLSFDQAPIGALLTAILDHSEAFFDAMALATGESRQFIGGLPPAIGVELLTVVVRLNSDFFLRSLAALASGAKATTSEIGTNRPGAGQTH